MKVLIEPSKANGSIFAPPSKSMAHRLLICAGLSQGKSNIYGISFSQDVLATLDCLEMLGASYVIKGNAVTINGLTPAHSAPKGMLQCRECGSTLRFMIPICMTLPEKVSLSGSETLMSRPLEVYENIAQEQNLLYQLKEGTLTVKGKLTPGKYRVTGSVSSQFISGLLFSLPLLDGDSVLELVPPVESRPYIKMTLQALSCFGIEISMEDENTFFIKGNQSYKSCDVTVEGDYSNAAFLEALNLVGGNVSVKGLNPRSLQGDKVYMQMYKELQMGKKSFDISNCPDLGPVMFAVATLFGGAEFTGTKRLKWKESDRAAAMAQELEKCGVSVTVDENKVIVGAQMLQTPEMALYGHNDHRIVMSLSILLTKVGGEIEGCEAVRKSYPDFFEAMKQLGVELKTDGINR